MNELEIFDNIQKKGINYLIDLYNINIRKKNRINDKEILFYEKYIINYFKLCFFDSIFEEFSSLNNFIINISVDNSYNFIEFIFNNLNDVELNSFLKIYYKVNIDYKTLINDFLFFTKKERICNILKENEDFIRDSFYVILKNSNCNSINDINMVENFIITIMNKISQKLILHEFYHYISQSIECTKYQYQVNEPLNYNIEKIIIFHNVFMLSLKIYENIKNLDNIHKINIEYILDNNCNIKLKDYLPIKKVENVEYINTVNQNIDINSENKKLITYYNNNLDNTDWLNDVDLDIISKENNEEILYQPNENKNINIYDNNLLITEFIYFSIIMFSHTISTYNNRIVLLNEEINYLRKCIKNYRITLELIILEKSKEIMENKINKLNNNLNILIKKRTIMYFIYDSEAVLKKINNLFNNFIYILLTQSNKNKNILYKFPQYIITDIIEFARHKLNQKSGDDYLFTFYLNLINNYDDFPNTTSFCSAARYCIKRINSDDNISKKNIIELINKSLDLYINLEKKEPIIDFHERLEPRFYMNDFFYRILLSEKKKDLMILNINENKINQFIYLLLNDYNYIVDEIFEKIRKIYEHENYITSLNYRTVNSYSKVIKIYYNFIECMHDVLLQIARNMPNILIEYNVLEKLINIINFFIDKIVGSEKKYIDIKNPFYYKFIKNDYLKFYIEIITYIFGQSLSKDIIKCMYNDKRSFKKENYETMIDIFKNEVNFKSKSSIIKLLLNKIDEYSELDDYDDIPDDLCDPLLSILIEQPVELPSTDIILDRRSITKHLLSSNTNPFDRSKLTIDELDEYNKKNDVIDRISNFIKKRDDWINSKKK